MWKGLGCCLYGTDGHKPLYGAEMGGTWGKVLQLCDRGLVPAASKSTISSVSPGLLALAQPYQASSHGPLPHNCGLNLAFGGVITFLEKFSLPSQEFPFNVIGTHAL